MTDEIYSFGPWRRLEDVAAMRADQRTPEAIGRLMALCEEGVPGAFRVIATA